MLSGKGKHNKKSTVLGKALGMFKPKKELIHMSKPETGNNVSRTRENVNQVYAAEDNVSQQFDPDLVRLSVMAGDPWDQFSLGGSDKNYSSDDQSLFAEEGEEKEMPNTSDDDEGANDEVYIDDNTSSGSVDHMDEQEDGASDEEEEEDTFDMSSDVAFQRNRVNTPTARGVGVTDSVIAFTSGSTLATSMNQIERIMEVNDNHQNHTCVEHEDSSALLDQLHRALRSSVVSVDPGPPKAVNELESELEREMHEADRLVRELEASRLTTKALEEKLNSRKAKMQNIEEIGEQVHMARAFALQSVKLKSFTLRSRKSSRKFQSPSKETSLDGVMIQEEGSSDESDQDSDVNNEDNVEVKADFCGSEQTLHRSHRDTTYEETLEANQEGSSNGNGVSKTTIRDEESFSPYEDELSDAVETAIASAGDERRKDCSQGFIETSLEKDYVRDRANGSEKSPDEKLRSSIQKAMQMEEIGEQVRQGRFQEFGEVELAIAGIGQDHGQVEINNNGEQSDMYMSELLELRARLHEQQQQIEYLEEERSYNVSKVAELNALVERAGNGDVMQHLAEKSVQVAELNHEISILREKLARSEVRSTALEAERDANKTVILNLSESLWKNDSLSGSANNATHAFIKQGGVIPASDAMELTIAHLQSKIESLEDENAAYKESVESLTASVLELTQENDARMLKIAALESQFLMLNKRGQPTSVVVSATSLDSPGSQQNNEKLLRFKAWANNKINQVQEQYENIKTDIEIRRVNTDPDQILT